MPDISNKFVVVTITQQEARVWATGIAPGSLPEKIYAPVGINNHHFRDDPKIKGRGDGPGVPVYLLICMAGSVKDLSLRPIFVKFLSKEARYILYPWLTTAICMDRHLPF